jgi:phage/plasmid-associated DNA primase
MEMKMNQASTCNSFLQSQQGAIDLIESGEEISLTQKQPSSIMLNQNNTPRNIQIDKSCSKPKRVQLIIVGESKDTATPLQLTDSESNEKAFEGRNMEIENKTVAKSMPRKKGIKPQSQASKKNPLVSTLTTLQNTESNPKISGLEKRLFHEHFDQESLLKLLSHPHVKENIDPNLIPMLIHYLHESEGGVKDVIYRRTDHGLGRLYGQSSMQSFPRRIRHTVSRNKYWDIDIRNCQPHLLSQLCRKLGIQCSLLDRYVSKRESILVQTMAQYSVSKDDAKELYIRAVYGGTFKAWAQELCVEGDPLDFVTKFQLEMERIRDFYWIKFEQYHKLVKDKDHPKGSLLAIVLNIEEDKILSEMVKFEEKKYNRSVDVLVFDGCQIQKDVSNPLTTKELEDCAEWIEKKTGFKITLIEKPMNEYYNDLDICKPLLHVICKNESDAAIELRKLHGQDLFKYCENTLYVYDKQSGLWNCTEKAIHQQLLGQYAVEMGHWLETINSWSKLYSMLQTLSGDATFLQRVHQSSLGKVLFRNGFYNFNTKTFSSEFDPSIFFPFRIERDYNPIRNTNHIEYVNLTLFVLPFSSKSTGTFIKQSLARAIAGCIRDKRIYFNIGPPNAGKGVLTDAMSESFGPYVGTFNGGVLQCQADKDSSLRNKEFYENRWCRALFSNEMPMNKPIDGIFLKVISSGGDKITGRKLFDNNSKFISHSTTFVNGNDRPKIVPADEATTFRLITTRFANTFELQPEITTYYDQQASDEPFDVDRYLKDYRQKEEIESLQVMSGNDDGNASKKLIADPDIKEKVQQEWFQDALFHIIADAYTKSKSQPPPEVSDFTKCWNSEDSFVDNLLLDFEVTQSREDEVTNKEIVAWCDSNGFKISAIKIGLEMSKVKGIEKVTKSKGASYLCLKRKFF